MIKFPAIFIYVFEPELEAYISQGWRVSAIKPIPSGFTQRTEIPYYRMMMEVDDE